MSNISFEAGYFATTVEVPILVDAVAEGDEVFYGTLTTVGSANVLITQSRADVHINDNDSAFNLTVSHHLQLPSLFLVFQFGCGLNRLRTR